MVTQGILLLTITLGSVLAVQNSFYSVQQDMQITSSSANLGVLRARSKLECSVLCSRDKQCASAEYKTGTRQCKLHGDSPQYKVTGGGQTITVTLQGSCPSGHAQTSTQVIGPLGYDAGAESFNDREFYLQHGCITGIRSWSQQSNRPSGLQIRYGAFWTPVRGGKGANGALTEVYLEAGEYIQKMKIYSGAVVDLWIPFSQKGRQLGIHGDIDTLPEAVSYNGSRLMYIEGAREPGHNAFSQLKFHMI